MTMNGAIPWQARILERAKYMSPAELEAAYQAARAILPARITKAINGLTDAQMAHLSGLPDGEIIPYLCSVAGCDD